MHASAGEPHLKQLHINWQSGTKYASLLKRLRSEYFIWSLFLGFVYEFIKKDMLDFSLFYDICLLMCLIDIP